MPEPIERRDLLKLALATPALLLAAAGPAGATADRPDVKHGPRSRNQVALTFHGAGPATLARNILREVANANAHISVMAIGTWLQQSPKLATAVLDGGHDLGNHTMNHYAMRHLSATSAEREVRQCAAELKKLVGNHGSWFRPSGTPYSTATIRAAARANGYPFCVSYDVDSMDYTDPAPKTIVANVLRDVKPGSIVSLHLGHANTLPALSGIFSGLAKRGLEPVTLTALLKG